MQFDLKLCDCPCNAFDKDAGMIVNSDGVFQSRGERAVAFALAANVQGVSSASSLQDPASTSVLWALQNKRKDNGQNDCATELRIQMQVPLESVHIVDESGGGLGASTPAVVSFYEDVMLQVNYAVDSGSFKYYLDEALFPIDSVCM